MMKGILWKSTDPHVGTMERRFCVLVGTLMLDFESAEDFANGVPPKAEGEIIAVSIWRGKGSLRGAHNEGLVYVTRLHCTNYCTALSKGGHEEWMSWMQTATSLLLGDEVAVAGDGADVDDTGILVTREALHKGVLEPPWPLESEVCTKTGVAFGLTQSRYNCTSCGKAFVQEHCYRRVPLPQHGFERAKRVCEDCLAAQQLLGHLRFLSSMLNSHLYQHRLARRGWRAPVERRLLRRGGRGKPGVLSDHLQYGLDLVQSGELSAEEFGSLVKAEERFQKVRCAGQAAACGCKTPPTIVRFHRALPSKGLQCSACGRRVPGLSCHEARVSARVVVFPSSRRAGFGS